MKVLYVGNENINQVVDAVRKKYTSLETLIAKTMKDVQYLCNRGDAVDRVIVFDSILSDMCDIANMSQLRKSVQSLIDTIKDGNVTEIVCVAQSEVTGELFLEELYEIMYNSAVYVVGSKLNMTDILAYSVQSISQLRQTSRKNIVQDIYQADDSVVWSDNKAIQTDWQQLGNIVASTDTLVDKFRLSIALEILDFYLRTATWEFRQELLNDEVQEQIAKSKDNKKKQPKPVKEKKDGPIKRFIKFLKSKLIKRA